MFEEIILLNKSFGIDVLVIGFDENMLQIRSVLGDKQMEIIRGRSHECDVPHFFYVIIDIKWRQTSTKKLLQICNHIRFCFV